MFGNVVDEQSAHCASVVRAGDGAVPFLTGGVPNLSLDGLVVHLNAAGGELDANRGFALQIKFISSKSRQQVTLSDARITNQNN